MGTCIFKCYQKEKLCYKYAYQREPDREGSSDREGRKSCDVKNEEKVAPEALKTEEQAERRVCTKQARQGSTAQNKAGRLGQPNNVVPIDKGKEC